MGGAVKKNQLFCILLKIVSLDFFIFCIKLQCIKGYKLPQTPFFRKILMFSKMGKMAQNRVFGLLSKIESLIFARNGLKLSVLWLANFLCKSHIWENSRSRDLRQKGPKVGGAVGKNQLFCILLKIVSLDFFHILHKVRGH